jgi:hypothetical protein
MHHGITQSVKRMSLLMGRYTTLGYEFMDFSKCQKNVPASGTDVASTLGVKRMSLLVGRDNQI